MTASSFTPSTAQWKRIVSQARNNGSGAIYWWVAARDGSGALRSSRARRVVKLHELAVKNRWVKVMNGAATCYAQWEDVGPFQENDYRYVFGLRRPRNPVNVRAGLDVSPAMRDCLSLTDGITPTNWRFVEASDVPSGPWANIVTTSQLNYDPPSCP
jgi:hypothetical protein